MEKDNLEQELAELAREAKNLEPSTSLSEPIEIKKYKKGPNWKTLIPAGLVALFGFAFVCGMDYAIKKRMFHESSPIVEQYEPKDTEIARLEPVKESKLEEKIKPPEPEKFEKPKPAEKKEYETLNPITRETKEETPSWYDQVLARDEARKAELMEKSRLEFEVDQKKPEHTKVNTWYQRRFEEIKKPLNCQLYMSSVGRNSVLIDDAKIYDEIRGLVKSIYKESDQRAYQELLDEIKGFTYISPEVELNFAPLATLSWAGTYCFNKRIKRIHKCNPFKGESEDVSDRYGDKIGINITDFKLYGNKNVQDFFAKR
ncbi:MAG: hypothetical protein ABIH72_02535 [archaeon]